MTIKGEEIIHDNNSIFNNKLVIQRIANTYLIAQSEDFEQNVD